MAIQEFDRPLRRAGQNARWTWDFFLSLALLIAAVGFIGYTIMSLPGPANERPLASLQSADISARSANVR